MLPERGAPRVGRGVPVGRCGASAPTVIEHLFEYWFGFVPGSRPAMPASLGRSFFQIIHRMSPTRGMKKPRTAQPKEPVSDGFLP